MIEAPTLEDLYDRLATAWERYQSETGAYAQLERINYLTAHAAFQRALIVQARADAAMRGEP